MQHILVTGSNGMLGRETVNRLLENGFNVMGISIEEESFCRHEKFLYKKLDLTMCIDVERLFAEYTFSHIIHLAAMAHINKSMDVSWSRYYRINTLCSKTIFECAAKAKTPVFFASTIDVYGVNNKEVDEFVTPQPTGKYAYSKFLAEKLLMETYINAPYMIARFSPIYFDDNRKDIRKRFYIRYPAMAYKLGNSLEFEFVSSKKAVDVILHWVINASILHGIINIRDEKRLVAKEFINNEKKQGNAKIVIAVSHWVVTCIRVFVDIVFAKHSYAKFIAYKILQPRKTSDKKMLSFMSLKK